MFTCRPVARPHLGNQGPPRASRGASAVEQRPKNSPRVVSAVHAGSTIGQTPAGFDLSLMQNAGESQGPGAEPIRLNHEERPGNIGNANRAVSQVNGAALATANDVASLPAALDQSKLTAGGAVPEPVPPAGGSALPDPVKPPSLLSVPGSAPEHGTLPPLPGLESIEMSSREPTPAMPRSGSRSGSSVRSSPRSRSLSGSASTARTSRGRSRSSEMITRDQAREHDSRFERKSRDSFSQLDERSDDRTHDRSHGQTDERFHSQTGEQSRGRSPSRSEATRSPEPSSEDHSRS